MTGWAADSLVTVSVLILLVLAIRRPFAAAFGARAAYALWLAPAVRAVMPPLPDAPLPSIFTSMAGPVDFAIMAGPGDGPALPWLQMLVVGWLAGAALFLGFHLVRHHRFLRRALAEGRPLTVDGIEYDVVASPRVEGPVATGLVHPLILVPGDFEERFAPEQQRLALWHERLHHRRGDIWASAAALILTALLWFNPFAHLALGAFRRDMESACDARLLAEAGRTAAPAYAETILRCAARPVPRSLCALTSIDELKGRLMMLESDHGAARRLAGLFLAGSVTIAGLAIAPPAVAIQETEKEHKIVERIEIRQHKGEKEVIVRNGGSERMTRIAASCDGEKFEIGSEGDTGERKENVRFVICTKSGENLLPALEKAAARIESDTDMAAERKADILAKLRAKIAELRAKG